MCRKTLQYNGVHESFMQKIILNLKENLHAHVHEACKS